MPSAGTSRAKPRATTSVCPSATTSRSTKRRRVCCALVGGPRRRNLCAVEEVELESYREKALHHLPRLLAAGVDHNDFHSIVAGMDRWEDWSPAWERVASVHE